MTDFDANDWNTGNRYNNPDGERIRECTEINYTRRGVRTNLKNHGHERLHR